MITAGPAGMEDSMETETEKKIRAEEASTQIGGLVRLAKLCGLDALAEELSWMGEGDPETETLAMLARYEAAVDFATDLDRLPVGAVAKAKLCVDICMLAVAVYAKPGEEPAPTEPRTLDATGMGAAMLVVDMFDQANTNRAIVDLGSRGELVAVAVNGLRLALVRAGMPPTFATDPQVPT